jgi:hypothetical protein
MHAIILLENTLSHLIDGHSSKLPIIRCLRDRDRLRRHSRLL